MIKRWLLFMSAISALNGGPPPEPRAFDRDPTDEDKKNISYIITTLAENSYFGLLGYKGKLEDAGDNVRHVHPLRFLGLIFEDNELTRRIAKVRDKWVWSRFWTDMKGSLTKEREAGGIPESVAVGFSQRMNSPDLINLVKESDWDGMIERLLEKAKD